jgi:hypothetical protein
MSKKNAETAVLFIMDTLLTIDSSLSTTEFYPNLEYAVNTKD